MFVLVKRQKERPVVAPWCLSLILSPLDFYFESASSSEYLGGGNETSILLVIYVT